MERIYAPLFTLLPLTLIPALFAGYLIFRCRRLYREIDRMLDAVLTRQTIPLSDLKEGPLSALAAKPSGYKSTFCWKSSRLNRKKSR